MSDGKKDQREKYNYSKDAVYKPETYTKDDLIDLPFNQAKRYDIGSTGVPYQKSRFEEVQKEEQLRKKLEEEVEQEEEIVEELNEEASKPGV